MNEHEQIMAIIRAKNASPMPLDPRRTALIVVDMQRYFTQPSFPFTEVFNALSPGASSGYLLRVPPARPYRGDSQHPEALGVLPAARLAHRLHGARDCGGGRAGPALLAPSL